MGHLPPLFLQDLLCACPPGRTSPSARGLIPPRPSFIQAPLWHSDAFPLPWVPTRSPLSPGVRVSGGAGTAGLSARNSPSGICSSVFSACVSAEPEGRDWRDCMGQGVFDRTEKVPGVNLHHRTPRLSSRVLVMVTGPRCCGHPAGRQWRFAWLHPRFISLMAVNLWRQNSHVRERNQGGQEPCVGKTPALPPSAPQ